MNGRDPSCSARHPAKYRVSQSLHIDNRSNGSQHGLAILKRTTTPGPLLETRNHEELRLNSIAVLRRLEGLRGSVNAGEKVPVRSALFKEHAVMQCEKEVLKHIDDVIAVIHQALKMGPVTWPPPLRNMPTKQWRTGAGTNAYIYPGR
jgi:hypothetical protein